MNTPESVITHKLSPSELAAELGVDSLDEIADDLYADYETYVEAAGDVE